jgi:hypothetical protein
MMRYDMFREDDCVYINRASVPFLHKYMALMCERAMAMTLNSINLGIPSPERQDDRFSMNTYLQWAIFN